MNESSKRITHAKQPVKKPYKRSKTAEQRFWEKVDKTSSPRGCWLWTKGDGYGVFWAEGKCVSAHRFSWLIHFGQVPDRLDVLHTCDTPACVNPQHLWLGTNADNVADMLSKGRQAAGDKSSARLHPESLLRGTEHPNAKLNDEQVRFIRAAYTGSNRTQQSLANEFGVNQTIISDVILKRTWKHVT